MLLAACTAAVGLLSNGFADEFAAFSAGEDCETGTARPTASAELATAATSDEFVVGAAVVPSWSSTLASPFEGAALSCSGRGMVRTASLIARSVLI
jgi:hypothetical protein